MAVKPWLAALLLALSASQLCAQEGAAAAPEPERNFFYKLDPNGTPVFTQLLRWEADPNALEFQVIVRDASEGTIIDERGAESQREVHLAPGSYTYKIVTYNLLGKAEAETDWIAIEVIKAEQPTITASSPKTIYMDTLDERVTIVGEKLLEKGSIVLIDAKGKKYAGTVKTRKGDQEEVVIFPDDAYQPGTYALYAENPGGLSTSVADALIVRFQRPVDILFSVGYSPLIALYDTWFAEKWTSAFHPLGFSAQLGLFFIKQRWGSLGIELGAEGRRLSGGTSDAAFTSDFILFGANFMYKARFTRQFHGIARAGGGLSRSTHNFDYAGFAGPSTISSDPFIRAGFALQAFLPWKLYGEIGVDWSWIFLLNHHAVGLTPKLCVGYQIF